MAEDEWAGSHPSSQPSIQPPLFCILSKIVAQFAAQPSNKLFSNPVISYTPARPLVDLLLSIPAAASLPATLFDTPPTTHRTGLVCLKIFHPTRDRTSSWRSELGPLGLCCPPFGIKIDSPESTCVSFSVQARWGTEWPPKRPIFQVPACTSACCLTSGSSGQPVEPDKVNRMLETGPIASIVLPVFTRDVGFRLGPGPMIRLVLHVLPAASDAARAHRFRVCVSLS